MLESRTDVERGRTIIVASGRFRLPESLTFLSELERTASPEFFPDLLLDASAMETAPSASELRSLAQLVRAIDTDRALRGEPLRRRRAVVVGASMLLYGVARMFELIVAEDERRFAIFRTIDEAERWLDAPPSP